MSSRRRSITGTADEELSRTLVVAEVGHHQPGVFGVVAELVAQAAQRVHAVPVSARREEHDVGTERRSQGQQPT